MIRQKWKTGACVQQDLTHGRKDERTSPSTNSKAIDWQLQSSSPRFPISVLAKCLETEEQSVPAAQSFVGRVIHREHSHVDRMWEDMWLLIASNLKGARFREVYCWCWPWWWRFACFFMQHSQHPLEMGQTDFVEQNHRWGVNNRSFGEEIPFPFTEP
jgi:hypothetical protein